MYIIWINDILWENKFENERFYITLCHRESMLRHTHYFFLYTYFYGCFNRHSRSCNRIRGNYVIAINLGSLHASTAGGERRKEGCFIRIYICSLPHQHICPNLLYHSYMEVQPYSVKTKYEIEFKGHCECYVKNNCF